jgi:hypothetical protein
VANASIIKRVGFISSILFCGVWSGRDHIRPEGSGGVNPTFNVPCLYQPCPMRQVAQNLGQMRDIAFLVTHPELPSTTGDQDFADLGLAEGSGRSLGTAESVTDTERLLGRTIARRVEVACKSSGAG